MAIFLSKLLPLLVYPLGLGCLLLLAHLLLRSRRRLSLALGLAALLVLWAGGNRWTALSLARSLEWRHLPSAAAPSADVIIVLGGATEPFSPPRNAVEVNGAADRLLHAAHLYHSGAAPWLLLSGGNIDWMDGAQVSPAAQMADLLEFMGVPRSAMILEERSRNTEENAREAALILKERGFQSALLVTSAMHMPRSLILFECQGVNAVPAPADFTVTRQAWDDLTHPNAQSFALNLLPNASSLSLTTNVMKEYIGAAAARYSCRK